MSDTKKAREKDNSASTPTSKRCRPSDSIHSSPGNSCCTEVSDILLSIDNKLSGLDARIAFIEVLHKEFQQLRGSLEFSQEQITTLAKENKSLQHSVTSLTTQFASVTKENKDMKETILDLQSRSMRDNLVFSGIPEQTHNDNPEQLGLIQEFMITLLKISPDTVSGITFHRVHRVPRKQTPTTHSSKIRTFQTKTTGTTSRQTTERHGLWT